MNFKLTLKRRHSKRARWLLYQFIATCAIPGLIATIYILDLILFNALKLLLVGWFTVFVVLPLVFKFSYSIQRSLLFLNFVRYPTNLDLSKPDTLGLYATRSFHVNYEDEDKQIIRIACWHVLPNTIAKRFHKQLQLSDETLKNITNDPHYKANYLDDPAEARYKVVEQIIGEYYDSKNVDDNRRLFEEILRQTHNPICLYIHGNTGSRANGHRVEVYKTLRRLGYHVIAIDYRGFADSSDVSPTERGCVADALAVYSFIKNLTNNPVFVYGHSLGTGISLHMVSIVNKSNMDNPRGVILESPFNNMRDEILLHPFSWPFKYLPWYESTILKPIYDNGFRFESDQHISEFRAPLLIMHAEDDRVIPLQLGYKLYRTALETRGKSWGPVEFHRFDGKFGHKYIVRAKNFASIVDEFIKRYRDETY